MYAFHPASSFVKKEYKKDTCVVRYQAYTCVVSNYTIVLYKISYSYGV